MAFPDLRILFMTVGESVSLQSLEALKEHTKQPYQLTIWYDACGRGVDWDFYRKLRDYSDDIFLLTKNHSPIAAVSYALLYLEGKYIMIVPADNQVQENYLDRFAVPFAEISRMAVAGCIRVDNHPEYKPKEQFYVNKREFMPDGILLFSKEAIDDVGGIAACFKGYGHENTEWMKRAMKLGWNVVSCEGIMKELGTTHDGRNMNPNVSKEIEASTNTYLKILDSDWKEFKWWDSHSKELAHAVS